MKLYLHAALIGALLGATVGTGVAIAQARPAVGHPDWTGVWDSTEGLAFDPATADPPGNSAQGTNDRIHPPYNKEWEAKYDAVLAEHRKGKIADPINFCVPHGFPRVLGGKRGPIQFMVTPVMFQMEWDSQSQIHRVAMNVPHPKPDDVWNTLMGDAVGHWEGETLVIDSILSTAGQFDRSGAPFSDQIHTVEHISQTDEKTLVDEITIEDPVAFTKPWHVTRRFKKAPPGLKMIDDFCVENNRNPVVNGVPTTVLGSDLAAQEGH